MASTVYEITRRDLQELKPPALASITDVQPLSSYNWIEAPNTTPTIAVPGSPALWSAPEVSLRLKKDFGLVYISQNAARHPESPLEPLFRALYTTCPAFDIRSIDVVTDRNNIRKLLSFIDPSSTRDGLEPFTISIEMKKNTAIFCRNETKTVEYIGSQEFRGFGHEFERAYTVSQISGSTGHHRIISYRFGDLKFIVRHETDGYVDTNPKLSSKAKDPAKESLSDMLGALSLSSGDVAPAKSKLIIRKEGHEVPLVSTLEIKTRVLHRPLQIQEVAPQLWISQTPKLVRAYHRNGNFQKPAVEDISAEIKNWEERKQNDLQKLAALIRKIIDLAKKCEGKAILKYNAETEKLVVSKVEMKEMLPKDLYSKWDDDHSAQDLKITQTTQETLSTANHTKTIPQPKEIKDNLETTVRIGGLEYNVQVSKMPYLASFVRLQKLAHPEATEFIHEPIQLFDVALKGVRLGYRQCFRSLPIELSQYHTLFDTYKFLNVDILNGLTIDEVITNLKAGKTDYDHEEKQTLRGNKCLARDTAFQFLYLIFHGEFRDEKQEGTKLFNAVMFVVSHPGIFKHRTKRVIRAAYEERFMPTANQRARLDQWEKSEPTDGAPDVTTDEEFECYSNSDDYSS